MALRFPAGMAKWYGWLALDCCDREVISHVTTTGGITGKMVGPDYSITPVRPVMK